MYWIQKMLCLRVYYFESSDSMKVEKTKETYQMFSSMWKHWFWYLCGTIGKNSSVTTRKMLNTFFCYSGSLLMKRWHRFLSTVRFELFIVIMWFVWLTSAVDFWIKQTPEVVAIISMWLSSSKTYKFSRAHKFEKMAGQLESWDLNF